MDLVLINTAKAMGEHENKWVINTPLGLNYAGRRGIFDENVSKNNKIIVIYTKNRDKNRFEN